MNSVFKLKSS